MVRGEITVHQYGPTPRPGNGVNWAERRPPPCGPPGRGTHEESTMALDTRTLDELARRVTDAMPDGIRVLQEDLERTVRTVVQSALARLDLVTREEFDAQAGLLARTREKVEALERAVEELEARLATSEDKEQP